MIWPVVPFLRRYALPIGVLLAIGTAYVYHCVELDSARKAGYESARAEYAAQLAEANTRQAARDAQARKAFQAKESRWVGERHALQTEIDAIARRVQPVRLCKPATDRRELPGAGTAASSVGGASESRFDHLPDGFDTGPGLVQLAGECESYRRRLIELKDRWP